MPEKRNKIFDLYVDDMLCPDSLKLYAAWLLTKIFILILFNVLLAELF